MNAQKGFTLIELMIAMVIGLILVAAVAQVYVMAIRTGTTQRAAAGILDANVFGLQSVERSLRMSGLGMSETSTANSLCSGIVVNANDTNCFEGLGGTSGTNPFQGLDKVKLLTSNDTGIRTQGTPSHEMPQLTIQYRAPVDMRDCEGRLALGPRKVTANVPSKTPDAQGLTAVDGQVIIERYFVKTTSNGLELRCDAGRYVIENITTEAPQTDPDKQAAAITTSGVRGLGNDDSLVVAGIDDFDVQLGVKTGNDIQYLNIKDAITAHASSPIVSVRLAILAKGSVATPKGDVSNDTYTIFDREMRYPADATTGKQFIRRTYESTVMLRNARGS